MTEAVSDALVAEKSTYEFSSNLPWAKLYNLL